MSNKKKHRNRARREEQRRLNSVLMNCRFGKFGKAYNEIVFDEAHQKALKLPPEELNKYLNGEWK